jgi:hypothetical protein
VGAAPAATLSVVGFPSTTTAGVTQTFTVTAYDPYGNTATGYTGTVHFTTNDIKFTLPADYTFAAANKGTHTFSAALDLAATARYIRATDTVTSTITGTESNITVNPGPFAKIALTLPASPWTAGTAQSFTVTAEDIYGNAVTGYTGTMHFTSTDPKATSPADYTFTTADAGKHTFTSGVTLFTAGTQTVQAADLTAGISTGVNAKVKAAAASSVTVSGYPSPTTAGSAHNFTVTLYDVYGNIATGYLGTIHFTSSDPSAVLPADYTFTTADAGKHTTFSATLKTTGTRSITATDTGNSNLAGTQSGITVQ